MYEEPYRWVEAVGNRRTYLDEQFKQGSPVMALAYEGGILLTTVSKGTPKLYEIYDRIALGGMGHPADLEKLRFSLLEMAHVEGFNRSPSDVTGARLMKYGLAPAIKQAFEEIYKAPFIVKILLAELGLKPERDAFLTINYDGTFEESRRWALLAANQAVLGKMGRYLQGRHREQVGLSQALETALCTWAVGALAQVAADPSTDQGPSAVDSTDQAESEAEPDRAALVAHLRKTLAGRSLECVVLERGAPGSSTYRTLRPDELTGLLPSELTSTTPA